MVSSEAGQFAFWVAIGAMGIGFWVTMYPLVTAFARRVGAGGREERLEQLEARLVALEQRGPVTGEVQAQGDRLAELEERVEFAERMLAQQREMSRVGPVRGDG